MSNTTLQLATFGGGCFWCTEAVFNALHGVDSVKPGYSGGRKETADYKTVCSGETQHAEVIQIAFDPTVISYETLLEIFFTTHDPTTLNRQGNDKGPQYRSVIFFHDDAQREAAKKAIYEFAPQVWSDPIVTELSPLIAFYEAEAYHHDYYARMGDQNSYCTFVVGPKVAKFRKAYSALLKA